MSDSSQTARQNTSPAPNAALLDEIAFLRARDAIGGSARQRELFDFLAECTLEGRAPKESEVHFKVFGGDAATADSAARVYVHRLRRRLEAIYRRPEAAGRVTVTIPKGEYRLVTGTRTAAASNSVPMPSPVAAHRKRRWTPAGICVAAALLLFANTAAWFAYANQRAPASRLDQSSLWADITVDDGPLIVVVGDYYMFGEYEDRVVLRRLVRDFEINSKEQLVRHYLGDASQFDRYSDIATRFLPASAGYALADLANVLEFRSDVRVKLASEITPNDLKSSDIIYVGLINGMNALKERVFARSRYKISHNRITDSATGQTYASEALFAAPTDTMYRDYGLVSTFKGITGNRIVVIAGAQDTALAGMTEKLTDPVALKEFEKLSSGAREFEALFEVSGQTNVDLESRLIGWSKVDSSAVWTPAEQTASN